MAHNPPDYAPSEMSRDTPLPNPGPATRRNRPVIPRNAVMSREHPPLYAGDYNNNLSKDMYWWEKLDINDPEEKRILLAMYYGEERQSRCNVCEKRNRACMWFLGEEDQLNKSCVKCRRVHATCKPVESMETVVDDPQPSIEICEDTSQQRTSHKRKSDEVDARDRSKTSVKRTRSSLQANTIREPTDEHPEVVHARPKEDQEAGELESNPQNNFETSPGLSQIEKGLCALIDQRYKSELESLRMMIKKQAADHQAQLMALRADFTSRDQQGEAVDKQQMKKLETQVDAEGVNRRRLEDENLRLKNRMARLEGGQEAGMNDLQDQIRQLREDMSLR